MTPEQLTRFKACQEAARQSDDMFDLRDDEDLELLLSEVERLTRERDALLRACYRQEGVDAFYTCHPASESYGHRFRSEAEVVAAILTAIRPEVSA